MEESNMMKEMSVNKLMVRMGIPMILSMALQVVYNIVDSAYNRTSGNHCTGFDVHYGLCDESDPEVQSVSTDSLWIIL